MILDIRDLVRQSRISDILLSNLTEVTSSEIGLARIRAFDLTNQVKGMMEAKDYFGSLPMPETDMVVLPCTYHGSASHFHVIFCMLVVQKDMAPLYKVSTALPLPAMPDNMTSKSAMDILKIHLLKVRPDLTIVDQ